MGPWPSTYYWAYTGWLMERNEQISVTSPSRSFEWSMPTVFKVTKEVRSCIRQEPSPEMLQDAVSAANGMLRAVTEVDKIERRRETGWIPNLWLPIPSGCISLQKALPLCGSILVLTGEPPTAPKPRKDGKDKPLKLQHLLGVTQ